MAGKWYRDALEADELFMAGWREDEAWLSRQCHASTVGEAQGNGGQQEEGKETLPSEWREGGQQEE